MKFLSQFRYLIFDMDGVLRTGKEVIPGSKTIFTYLLNKKISPIIVTNECRYTHKTIRSDLTEMGIQDIQNIPIYTPYDMIYTFLKKKCILKEPIQLCVFGESGLKEKMKELVRFSNITIQYKIDKNFKGETYAILGASHKLDRNELRRAQLWLQEPNVKIITTCNDLANVDEVFMPREILKYCNIPINRSYCFGKPNPLFMNYIISSFNKYITEKVCIYKPPLHKIMFIGDSMDTDIRGSFENNIKSCLVLTGNTKKIEDIRNSVFQPDYIINTLDDLSKIIEK